MNFIANQGKPSNIELKEKLGERLASLLGLPHQWANCCGEPNQLSLKLAGPCFAGACLVDQAEIRGFQAGSAI